MGFVRPSRALRTNWPHAADIRTRLGGTGEARSDTTGFPIRKLRLLYARVGALNQEPRAALVVKLLRKCSPCRAGAPFGGGEAFAYEHSPGRGVAGLLHHACS